MEERVEMGVLHTVLAMRDAVLEIVTRHSAERPRIFGSVARCEDGPESDIDILVDAGPGCTLLSVIAMEDELKRLFDRDVDVRTLAGLHPSMRSTVLLQAIDL